MGVFFIVLAIALVIFMVFKGVPIFFTAIISSAVLLLLSGMNPLAGLTGDYITGLSGYFGAQFWLFIPGALFGKMYEASGAADSIATTIINKLGEKAIVPAVIIVGFLLSLGGVSVFVAFFAMYPLMLSMFKKADISRTLIPMLYFAGAGTATGMLPGTPAVQNTIACEALGVSYSAAAAPGWIAGIFEMVLVFVYTLWAVKHSKTKGEHFEMTEADKAIMEGAKDRKLPSMILALIPMIILLVLLNLTPLGAAGSLLAGVIAACVCFFQFYDVKNIFGILGQGLTGGINSLFSTSAIVGFGTVVKAVPAFQTVITAVTGMGGNPLISSVVAVAVLAGVCGSGSGGEGIALPIIKEYMVPMGVNVEALARCTALASLTLDSLPQNGLVVSVLTYTGNTHKQSYLNIAAVTVVIPIISLILLMILCPIFGYT